MCGVWICVCSRKLFPAGGIAECISSRVLLRGTQQPRGDAQRSTLMTRASCLGLARHPWRASSRRNVVRTGSISCDGLFDSREEKAISVHCQNPWDCRAAVCAVRQHAITFTTTLWGAGMALADDVCSRSGVELS